MTQEATPHHRSLWALDWLNVLVADVKTGLGPYLAVYLQASRHWAPVSIGLAMSAMGFASVVAQIPTGALTDHLRHKRWMIVAAAAVVATGCLWMVMRPTLLGVLAAQALIGSTATIFPASLAAITLGLVGPAKLAERMGRNEAFNHAGNVGAALLAGLIGYAIALEGIFYLVIVLSGATILMVLLIRADDIDDLQARGARTAHGATHISRLGELFASRPIAIFALAAVLFQCANAAMLPLLGQRLSVGHDHGASLYMSACIMVAQCVMMPVAIWAGQLASTQGRKPVFMLGFCVLPVRGVLYTLSDNPSVLVAMPNLRVAAEMCCDRHTVRLWRTRYLAHGLTGLQDAPRTGRPRRFSPLGAHRRPVARDEYSGTSPQPSDAMEP